MGFSSVCHIYEVITKITWYKLVNTNGRKLSINFSLITFIQQIMAIIWIIIWKLYVENHPKLFFNLY